jgi:branched-chain amino acid transport system substrate-binding protein
MSRSSKWITGLLAAVCLALTGCGAGAGGGSPSQAKTLTFAVAGPLTGENAAYGSNLVKGVRLAVDEINSQGGASGKRFAIKTFDDKCNPTEAANVASRITSDRSIFAVIGHVCSSSTLAAMPIYRRAGLTVVSASSTAPNVTKQGYANFSRTIPSDATQGAQLVEFAVKTLGKKRIALVYASDDFGQGLYGAAKPEVAKAGGELAGEVTYTPSTTKDFTPQLTRIAASRSEVIVMLGYYNDMGTMVSQLDRAGLSHVTLLGCAGIAQPDYAKLAGKAGEGTYIISYYDPANPLPANQAFVRRFKDKFGTEPNEQAAYGYEVPFIYKAAVEQGATKETLGSAVRKVTYEGPTGKTRFADTGDVIGKSGVVVVVKNSRLVLDSRLTKQAEELAQQLGS